MDTILDADCPLSTAPIWEQTTPSVLAPPIRPRPRFCKRSRHAYDPDTGEVYRCVCGRWSCSWECFCRWRWPMARRLVAVLRVHPHHHVRLTCLGHLPDRQLTHAHSAFFRHLKRKTNLAFWWVNEWLGPCSLEAQAPG